MDLQDPRGGQGQIRYVVAFMTLKMMMMMMMVIIIIIIIV